MHTNGQSIYINGLLAHMMYVNMQKELYNVYRPTSSDHLQNYWKRWHLFYWGSCAKTLNISADQNCPRCLTYFGAKM